MGKLANIMSRIRIVPKKSSKLTVAVVTCCFVLCLVAVLVLGSAIHNYKAQTEALKDQAAQLEQENSQLEDKNDKKGTLEGLLEFAKDFLGLIDPDSVIFDSES